MRLSPDVALFGKVEVQEAVYELKKRETLHALIAPLLQAEANYRQGDKCRYQFSLDSRHGEIALTHDWVETFSPSREYAFTEAGIKAVLGL